MLPKIQHFPDNTGLNPELLYRMQHFSSSRALTGKILVFHTTIRLNTLVFRNPSCKTYNIYADTSANLKSLILPATNLGISMRSRAIPACPIAEAIDQLLV
jgi:hypothetical protein